VARQTFVIRLELHPDDESVSGRASVSSGAVREFVGWMGLVAAIDALVRESSWAAAGSPRAGDGGAAQ
jgi:hypothetical protein